MSIDVEFEQDVLAACMSDLAFIRAALPVLRAHDFSSKTHAWIWQQIADVYGASHELPTAAVFSARIDRSYRRDEDREYVARVLVKLHRRRPSAPRAALEEIRRFARMAALRRAAGGMIDGLDADDVERAEAALFQGATDTKATSILEEPHGWEESWAERLAEYIVPEDDRITYRTPLPTLNRITGGGLRPGTLGLLVALTNVGKSTMACDLGYNALVHSNAAVVHFTTEETHREATARYDARFTGFPRDHLLSGRLTMDERRRFGERFERVMGDRKSRLVVHELPPHGPVTAMRPVVERLREDYSDAPLLFVCDSPEHLTPGVKMENYRLAQSSVFWTLKSLTLDATLQPLAGWSTGQVPQRYVGKRLNVQAVSETQDKSRVVDLMIGLEESEDDRADGRTRAIDVVLLKSRLGRIKRYRIYTDVDTGTCEYREREAHAEEEDE